MLDIEARDGSEVATVRVTVPRLDAATAPGFKQAVLGLVDDGHRRIAMDLSALEFLDSTGLGTLVALLKAVGPTGELAIVGARPQVRKLFGLTRLDRVFRLYETADDAGRALSS